MNIHLNPKRCDFPNCGKSFATNPELSHQVIHLDNKPFKCTFNGCEFETKLYNILENHKKSIVKIGPLFHVMA